jgi:hypothetical protein
MTSYEYEVHQEKVQKAELERGVALVVALGLTPFKDGDQWCYLLGENLQEGISGFGHTPFQAAQEFECNFCSIPKAKHGRKET